MIGFAAEIQNYPDPAGARAGGLRLFRLSYGRVCGLDRAHMKIHIPSPTSLRRLLAAAVALAMVPFAGAQGAPAKKAVQSADDLPRHTYAVTEAPSAILGDDAAFAALASAVRKDIESDLRDYDIKDRTTLEGYKGTQLALAMLDRDYAATDRLVGELRAIEEKPSLKLTTGLVSEAWAEASREKAAPAGMGRELGAILAKKVSRLPWDLVQDDIKSAKAGYEVRSPALIIGIAQQQFDPAAAKTSAISATVARQLVAMRNQLVNLLPYKADIVSAYDGVVSTHKAVMPDLWSARLVALPPTARAQPVRVGIWDSGVDEGIFKDSVVTDAEGRHGIAFDLHSNPSPDLLFPLGDAKANLPEYIGRLKGFIDVTASVDSKEASDLKRYMSGLKQDQVKPTLENLQLVENYAHGTHVTGIALAGNPFAQLVIGRITFDYHMIPETPTIEQARKDAAAYQAVVDYFKKSGVRVVNMSWGGSLKEVENDLEANGAGGNAGERKKLARQIFDIGKDGLFAALRDAPGILFVVAAGNADDNVKFDEFIPSSYQLPNMITVGAVDQAGHETSFSSFGPMVNVHANGFEVESYIPGGQRLKFSGTSMASPQVTNLAAKLFALDPALTPAEAKALIMEGCDKDGRVNLVSPAKSIALLEKRLGAP